MGHFRTIKVQIPCQSILQRFQWRVDRVWCHKPSVSRWCLFLDLINQYFIFYSLKMNIWICKMSWWWWWETRMTLKNKTKRLQMLFHLICKSTSLRMIIGKFLPKLDTISTKCSLDSLKVILYLNKKFTTKNKSSRPILMIIVIGEVYKIRKSKKGKKKNKANRINFMISLLKMELVILHHKSWDQRKSELRKNWSTWRIKT